MSGAAGTGIGGRARLVYGIGAIAAAWLAAIALEFLTRLMANMYVHFGSDLPGPTMLTLHAVRSYVPWMVAGAATLLILFLVGTASGYILHACAAIGTVVAASIAAGGLALALPAVKMCGDYVLPEWPDRAAASAKPAEQGPLALNSGARPTVQQRSCR